jgi:transcriptional regulator with XRE-family HTH domain
LTELANAIGVAKSTMSDYEKGKIPLTGARIEQLAAAMHFDPKHLHEDRGSAMPKKLRFRGRTKVAPSTSETEPRPPIRKMFIRHSRPMSSERLQAMSSLPASYNGLVRDAWHDDPF